MRKQLAVAAIAAAALLGGGATGLILTVPGLAGAQSATTDPSTATTTAPTTNPAPAAPAAPTKPTELPKSMQDAIDGLVANHTLTQEQADAVKKALLDSLPAKGPRRPGGGSAGRGPGFGPAMGLVGAGLD